MCLITLGCTTFKLMRFIRLPYYLADCDGDDESGIFGFKIVEPKSVPLASTDWEATFLDFFTNNNAGAFYWIVILYIILFEPH